MAWRHLKKHFLKFIRYESGRRFQHYYDLVNRRIKYDLTIKIILILLGIVSFLVGFILLFIPGPGTLFLVISAILLCLSSRKLAIWFDEKEVTVRKWYERYQKKSIKKPVK